MSLDLNTAEINCQVILDGILLWHLVLLSGTFGSIRKITFQSNAEK